MCIRTLCCASLVAYIYTESACCPLLESWKLSVWNCPDTCFIWIILSSTFTFTFHFPFHMFRILIFNIASSYRLPYHSLKSYQFREKAHQKDKKVKAQFLFQYRTIKNLTFTSLFILHNRTIKSDTVTQSFLHGCRQSSSYFATKAFDRGSRKSFVKWIGNEMWLP